MSRVTKLAPSTPTEALLDRLCSTAFLSLWSYPRVHRDQRGEGGSTVGKELCDLLVVFEDHIIIFSDKSCAIPTTGDRERDWSRWYKRAVEKSALQVFGAEPWIREHPARLFLDAKCTQPFPYPLAAPANAKVHRIVVARGAGIRTVKEFGGSGSLMVVPRLKGEDHYLPVSHGGMPFGIGWVDRSRGYVHVLDDTTLFILLETLDTITDFTSFLERKEKLIASDRLMGASGEEDLLAHYLQNLDPDGHHGFALPPDGTAIGLLEGHWQAFKDSPHRLAQKAANEVSYMWDKLIEKFCHHAFHGSSQFTTHPEFADHEKLLRAVARERRTARRALSIRLGEVVQRTPPNQHGARVVTPGEPGAPYYVFLVFPWYADRPLDENHAVRREALRAYVLVTKLKFPEAQTIIGLATESGHPVDRSEDLLLFESSAWTPELETEAREIQQELGILQQVQQSEWTELEYPDAPPESRKPPKPKSAVRKAPGRNSPCPCGSGRKYKKCHGH